MSSTRLSTGEYELRFNRAVDNCAATATDVVFADLREVSADASSLDTTDVVTVVAKSLSGSPADTHFYVSLDC